MLLLPLTTGGGSSPTVARLFADAMGVSFGAPTYTPSPPRWLLHDGVTENVAGWLEVPSGWATFDVFVLADPEDAAAGNARVLTTVLPLGANGAQIMGGAISSTGNNFAMPGVATQRVDLATGAGLAIPNPNVVMLQVSRQGANAGDTYTGSLGIVGVELRKVS